MQTQELIQAFLDACRQAFGGALTGVYLHGSLALGCFNPRTSDIDMIVVVSGEVAPEQKRALMSQIVRLNAFAPPKGLEISVVRREVCNPCVHPAPFELHFSPGHLNWYRRDPEDYIARMRGADPDLAAHFNVIQRRGVCLLGEPIAAVFGIVPKAYVVDSVWRDVSDAREDILSNPVYFILNLCRTLALLREDLTLSKAEGGRWALDALPQRLRPVVQSALDAYVSGESVQPDDASARAFVEELLGMIHDEMEACGYA